MKIRHTLTAAAAAVVLGPAAVLAAPAAAFAAEPVPKAGARTSDDGAGVGQSCAFESDQLQAAVHGLPRQLAAGGAWTPFSMTLANTTGKPLEKVLPFLHVSAAEGADRLETEYRDAKTGRWKTFHDAEPEDVFGFFAVGPRSTLTLQLRTRVVKDAKPGAGYALAAGDYRNGDGSCGSAKENWSDFTISPAGTKPTQPPTAKPSEPGKPSEPSKPGGTAEPSQSAAPAGGTGGSDSTGGLSPQGGGHLATTGSSSALPAIALAGGAAIVVGAGAVIGVRRRKGLAGPGATDITA
ncbi:LPXTG cell wall anchor domain-containing protein [Streptomyces tubercidicus]